MSPFDQAWDSITKFDFYMDPSQQHSAGSYAPPQLVQGNTAPQVSKNPIYTNRAVENRFQQSSDNLYGPQYGPAYQPPVADMSNTAYYRTGASEPRLSDDGSFTGVNLSAFDFTDDSKWNENVQNLAATGAHETVHSLIEDEIEPWAREQSGYEKPDNSLTGLDALLAQVSQESEPARKRAKSNYDTLREMGHEFGAWSSTPDAGDESGFISPDARRESMNRYKKIAPYMTGDKPFSELRTKSEPMDIAFQLLKEEVIDMVEMPPGSGNFVSRAEALAAMRAQGAPMTDPNASSMERIRQARMLREQGI